MKSSICLRLRRFGADFGLFLVLAAFSISALAGALQPVTVSSSQFPTASGGNGDSVLPVVSADGRYVVFASAANNLDAGSNYLSSAPAQLNVYLRDRTRQTTTLVSINGAGTGRTDSDALPRAISTNGQFVLFESAATNLAPGFTNGFVNGFVNVFVRDMVNNLTVLASAGPNGAVADGACRNSVMTPDGRYVAFCSEATNLVAGDTNGIADVFVRDLQMGVTVLASTGATANAPYSSEASDSPVISDDGQFVAFYSTATNLIPGVDDSGEVYLRNMTSGQMADISADAHGMVQSLVGFTNIFCWGPVISSNGQYVAYETCPTNSTYPPNSGVIFRYDQNAGTTDVITTNALGTTPGSELQYRTLDMSPDGQFIAFTADTIDITGANTAVERWSAQTDATAQASVNLNNSFTPGTFSERPAMDSSGRFVAFISDDTNLVTNIVAPGVHLYLRDLQAGTTTLIDADTNGTGSTVGGFPVGAMSADGSVVAFSEPDGSLVTNDNNHAYDLFARNLTANTMELISARQPALPSPFLSASCGFADPSVVGESFNPASGDGRYVVFSTAAYNAVVGDTNGISDVFLRDTTSGTTTLISINTNNVSGNGASYGAAISGDGRYVVFTSGASDLVPSDTNNSPDVFVRDLLSGTTALVSVNTNGDGPGNGTSSLLGVSTNGQYVLFTSTANNLAPPIVAYESGASSLLWRDLKAGVTRTLATSTWGFETAMTPDGQNVAYLTVATPFSIWNAAAASNVFVTNSITSFQAISPDATRVAYMNSQTPSVLDLSAKTNLTLSLGDSVLFLRPGAQFSADGRYLAYAGLPTNIYPFSAVHLYDFQTRTDLVLSVPYNGMYPPIFVVYTPGPTTGPSDSPAISPDGRFVAYRSFLPDLVPNDNNGFTDVFLYDQTTGTTRLVSVSQLGNFSANGPSFSPVFTADSRTLLFESWASDLQGGYFNSIGGIWSLDLYPTNSNAPPPVLANAGPAFAKGQGPTITWPVTTGMTYEVQYKNELSDPAWQPLTRGLIIVGSQGYFNDPAPPSTHRFYRIVEF